MRIALILYPAGLLLSASVTPLPHPFPPSLGLPREIYHTHEFVKIVCTARHVARSFAANVCLHMYVVTPV